MTKETSTPQPVQPAFLSRRYISRLRYFHGVIGPVPLADIVLLSILFLLAHSWIVLRPGIHLELPAVEFVDGVGQEAVMVSIAADGLMFFEDKRASLEMMPDLLLAARAAAPAVPLVIQADRRTDQQILLQLYGIAAAAGYPRVLLATQFPAAGAAPP
jgi:biopolymer transport protein ExbD